MTEEALSTRNMQRLSELEPGFASKVSAILSDLRSHGYRPRIQEGYRSPADQLTAYNTGHSKLRFGFHNITLASGKAAACAVDILDDNDPGQSKAGFFLALASSARSHGLATGCLWGLTDRQKAIVNTAIAGKVWKTPAGNAVRLGWDAGHVEPIGTTPKTEQTRIRGLAK